ncbi:MAG: tryptophan 2,3-dioxygenase family protein [Pseudomonadota bacterium]
MSSKDKPTNYREVEAGIRSTFRNNMAYADYLDLRQVLGAQQMLTDEHDEMLFVIIHQASELWIKLCTFELRAAMREVGDDNLRQAFKVMSRIKTILRQLTQSWDVLSTLTPVDYLKFRDSLGNASGFQSYNYRTMEFLLGNKNAQVIRVFRSNPGAHAALEKTLHAPSLYDIAIRRMAAHGLPVSGDVLERDVSQPYPGYASVESAWLQVYESPDEFYEFYELGEKLVDIEDAFQMWRFKHLSTVRRIIGEKHGTGGSSGLGFLKKALETSFFPELIELRTQL